MRLLTWLLLLTIVAAAQTHTGPLKPRGGIINPGGSASNINLTKVGGTTVSAANVVDAANTAFRVNCVTGCVAGGGGAVPIQVGRASDGAAVNVGFGAGQLNVPVSGTFWQATQPISGTVSISGTVPVSGTFWQATQPVSGTFWQTTQPISSTQLPAALDGSGFLKVHEQGTVPVTGTFWQATQPVSGTFWQATQPVSIAAAIDVSDRSARLLGHIVCDSGCTPGGSTADASAFTFGTTALNPMGAVVDDTATNTVAENSIGVPRMNTNRVLYIDVSKTAANTTAIKVDNSAVTQPVSGTFWQATQPVSGTFWQATQPVSGTVTANQGTANTAANRWPVFITDGTNNMPTGDAAARTIHTTIDNASLAVTGTFWQATQPVSGTITANAGTGTFTVAGNLTDNNAAPAATNLGILNGIARTDYHGGTAATAGRMLAPDVGTDGLVHVASLPDTSIKRYRASSKFAASSTTDNWRINGNASNTVIVTRLSLTCTQTTAGMVTVELAKRSTAGSGGTSATVTAVPLDSNKAAASSVVNSYTGTGPTVGTLVGDLENAQIGCMAAATATPNDIFIPATSLGAPIAVLRGTAEGLAINMGGALTGGNLTVAVEWMEVTTITP